MSAPVPTSDPSTRPAEADHDSRERVEERLEAYDRLKATLEALPDLLFVLDRDGRIYDFNAPARDRLYVPPEQFLGRTMNEVLPEPAVTVVNQAIADAVAHGHHHGSVYPLPTPGGDKWFEISIAAQGDPQTPAGRLVAIVRDITERKRAEDALRESEERIRLLADNLPHGFIYRIDSGMNGELHQFQFISQGIEKLHGLKPESVLANARLLYEQILEEDRPLLEASEVRAAETMTPLHVEIRCRHPSGALRWIHVSSAPHRLPNHHVVWDGIELDITARKRAQDALRESEQRLAQVARQSRIIVWETDADGRYTYVGPVAEEVIGYRPDELVGKLHYFDLHPEEGRDVFMAEIAEVMRQQLPLSNVENVIQTRTGDRIWVSTTAEPLLNPDGTLRGYRGSDMDITARKRAETERRESEKKYRELHETMRDAFCLVDMQGRIIEVNPALQVLTGYSEEELRAMTYLDLTPDKWHAFESRILGEQVMVRGYSEVYQKEYIRADGTTVPIELRTILLRNEDGQPTGMWASIRDITSRLRIEKALKQATTELDRRVKQRTAELEASKDALARSEEQFRQMAESMQEVFWLVDAQTRKTLYVSPAFDRLWGQARENSSSDLSAHADMIHPDDRHRSLAALMRAFETGELAPIEYRIQRPDGTIRWIEDHAWGIRDGQGRLIRLAGVMRDITERRQLEAEILRAAEAERQRIGRDLHDSLGQTLTGIGYLTEALRERLAREDHPEAAEAAKLSDLIEDAAAKAHAMARGMLLVNLDRGGLPAVLQELAFRTREFFGTDCTYQGLDEIDGIRAEAAGQLYRIAQEAATNAAKHARGTPIRIGLVRRPEGLLLSIQDTGPGLTQTPEPRAGIGLDIMRYRASLVNATLWIDSAPDQGTTVHCLLPLPSPPLEPAP